MHDFHIESKATHDESIVCTDKFTIKKEERKNIDCSRGTRSSENEKFIYEYENETTSEKCKLAECAQNDDCLIDCSTMKWNTFVSR